MTNRDEVVRCTHRANLSKAGYPVSILQTITKLLVLWAHIPNIILFIIAMVVVALTPIAALL